MVLESDQSRQGTQSSKDRGQPSRASRRAARRRVEDAHREQARTRPRRDWRSSNQCPQMTSISHGVDGVDLDADTIILITLLSSVSNENKSSQRGSQ